MTRQSRFAAAAHIDAGGASRLPRSRAVAGGLAAAMLLPSVVLPGQAAAQSVQSAAKKAKSLPQLSADPVKSSAKKATAKRSSAKRSLRRVVRSGESLWTISEGLAGRGASDAKVMRTVVAVWNANDVHIGTGDPDLLPTGITLKIPASLR